MVYKPTFNSSLIENRDKEVTDFASQIFGNTSFRIGVVLEAFDTESEENISKLGPEYTVMTVEQDRQNGQNTSIYKNCIAMDGFGGVADFFQFTRRLPKKPKELKKKGTMKDEVGSIVGLLCLDGNSEKAVIIGSFGNPSKGAVLTKEKGHHMEGEFNGINWQVDKDGALTIKFNSATEADGKPKDEAAGGTEWKIEKDGSFEFTDGETEKIRIDKTAKTIDMEAADDISVKTEKNVNVEATESINMTATKDFLAEATGKAAITAKKSIDIETKGKLKVDSQMMMVKSKSMIQMQSQSLFQMMSSSQMILQAPQVLIGPVGPAPQQPALLAYDLKVLGTGFLGTPVVSSVIAGFSTSVIISP